MRQSLTIVKVGGSLFDWPELGLRLRSWLEQRQAPGREALIVPGGGPTADVIRGFDRIHQLGEERAHGLALNALRLNAAFLAALLPGTGVVGQWEQASGDFPPASILDPAAFAAWDERTHPDTALPACWAVTSDSLAARAAVVYQADYLILLKSVTIPPPLSWQEAGERGFVDEMFASVLRQASQTLRVHAVNLRDESA